jgi:hypothetical protein
MTTLTFGDMIKLISEAGIKEYVTICTSLLSKRGYRWQLITMSFNVLWGGIGRKPYPTKLLLLCGSAGSLPQKQRNRLTNDAKLQNPLPPHPPTRPAMKQVPVRMAINGDI